MGSILANRPQSALPSDTKKNPQNQVLAIEVVNSEIKEPRSFTLVITVKAYVPPIPFLQ